jgi:hypothetical protein
MVGAGPHQGITRILPIKSLCDELLSLTIIASLLSGQFLTAAVVSCIMVLGSAVIAHILMKIEINPGACDFSSKLGHNY